MKTKIEYLLHRLYEIWKRSIKTAFQLLPLLNGETTTEYLM